MGTQLPTWLSEPAIQRSYDDVSSYVREYPDTTMERAGGWINDLRYLTTLAKTIKDQEASSSPAIQTAIHESWRRVERFLGRISLNRIDILSETNPVPYKEISSEEYGRFREQVARDIVALDAVASTES